MKKTFLTLLPLTALMALTGCGGTNAVVTPAKVKVAPEELRANTRSETMFVGESFSLNILVTPLLASDAAISFASSDPTVASVSKDGTVTALKQGSCVINVTADEVNNVGTSVKIYVFESKDIKEAKTKLTQVKLYQARYVKEPRKLRTEQVKTYTLYKNDQLYSKTTQYNNIIVSKDDAYVYFGGRDTYQKIDSGSQTRDYGAYQILTDNDYHSFIFHDGDNDNKYCYVATEFNLGTEYTRIDTVYQILDSLFNSGRDLVENCVEDAMGQDWFNYPAMVRSMGYAGENDLYIRTEQHLTQKSAEPIMEQNLDIPAYTIYDEDDYFRVYWFEGNVKHYYSCFGITYYVNGVKHFLSIETKNTFSRDDEFTITMPRTSDYELVADIFEL